MTLLLALFACGSTEPAAPVVTAAPPTVQRITGEALGTTWSVSWLGPVDEATAQTLATNALTAVDEGMSTWRPDSEIQAVRKGPGAIQVSEQTGFVVLEAVRLAEATGGAFDPTVQPLMELWGFHSKTPLDAPPTDAQVTETLASIGYEKVEVDASSEGVWTVDAGGTALDLSAIAKGHASDAIGKALTKAGATSWMVEVGGEVAAKGLGPSGTGWRLAVDAPTAGTAPGQRPVGVITLSDGGLATSGNYRNRRSAGGRTYGHTMDPRVGRPIETSVLSVSVVAPNCRTADGLATALMVLSPEEGKTLIEGLPETEAVWMLADRSGGWTLDMSGGAAAVFTPVPSGD